MQEEGLLLLLLLLSVTWGDIVMIEGWLSGGWLICLLGALVCKSDGVIDLWRILNLWRIITRNYERDERINAAYLYGPKKPKGRILIIASRSLASHRSSRRSRREILFIPLTNNTASRWEIRTDCCSFLILVGILPRFTERSRRPLTRDKESSIHPALYGSYDLIMIIANPLQLPTLRTASSAQSLIWTFWAFNSISLLLLVLLWISIAP